MKMPLDFIDPSASDDEPVTLPQGHLRDWHDRIEDLVGTLRIVRGELGRMSRDLGEDITKLTAV